MTIPVLTRSEAFLSAVAELPSSLERSREARGAIVVAEGVHEAAAAVEAGAIGLVLRAAVDETGGGLRELASRVPVVVMRPWLRPDLAELARSAVVAGSCVVLDAVCTAEEQTAVAADALGWARILLGGPLRPRAAEWTEGGILALLDGPRSDSVALLLSVAVPRGREASIRVEAVGESIVRIGVDAAAAPALETVREHAGTTQWPRRWEAQERLALRRVVDAVRAAHELLDVAELEADLAAVKAVGRIAGRSAADQLGDDSHSAAASWNS